VKGSPSTPPQSDSDPVLASSLLFHVYPLRSLHPTSTPINTLSTSGLQNLSTPCLSLQPGYHGPQASLPMHLLPPPEAKSQPPHSILDLTPELLRSLGYGSSPVHSVPCTLLEFLSWRHGYRNLLESESDKTLSSLGILPVETSRLPPRPTISRSRDAGGQWHTDGSGIRRVGEGDGEEEREEGEGKSQGQ